jgi:two-component system NtrC family sensor kinase
MVRRTAIHADRETAALLRRLADLVVSGADCDLSDVLSTLGRQLELRSALWVCEDGEARLLAAYPTEGLNTTQLSGRVLIWSRLLTEPLIREGGLDGEEALTLSSRSQLVWPLDLDDGSRAVWVVESDLPRAPDVGAVAEMLRTGVALANVRRRLRDLEAQLDDLRSAQELMGHIVDALPVGLYVVDTNYRIVAWNRKRETGTQGVAREDAIGKSVFDVLYRQPKDQIAAELEEVFATDEIRRFEVESSASGERRFYRLTKVPMHVSGSDEVTHVITVGEDITEQKRIADRISHAEKLAALGQMAAGVMHEINNPLATITAGVDALRECVDDDSTEQAEVLSMVETEVERCKRIARDLLAFSRPPPSEKGPADIQETVEETLKLLQHHDRFKKIRVQREYVYDLPLVWANTERLVQVFVALALNALDAMEDDGELRVRTEALSGGDEVAISFIDTGCGIPQSDLPKIFEPFYTSKPPGRGTGLGLSICYGIIQEHGGRIEVDSAIGLGSNFRVVLPAYRAEGSDAGATAGTNDTETQRG